MLFSRLSEGYLNYQYAKGRAEGYIEGRWLRWNELRLAAAKVGEEFDLPTPSPPAPEKWEYSNLLLILPEKIMNHRYDKARAEAHRRCEQWNNRRLATEAASEEFTAPPPFLQPVKGRPLPFRW